jgi:deoxyribodipyrimidine photo-lyase
MPDRKALVWLRRDLRLRDHSPLAYAENEKLQTAVAFVFDEAILSPLPRNDRRVGFFHAALEEIDAELHDRGSRLGARVGNPVKEIPRLARELGVNVVIASRDYEPRAIARDEAVATELKKAGIELLLLKDQVIFDTDEILNGSGSPYKVFTAYKNNWLGRLKPEDFDERGVRLPKFIPAELIPAERWDLPTLGFKPLSCWLEPGEKAAKKRLTAFGKKISSYLEARDVPSIEGTSGLSAHLRFGTVSIRACVREARKHEGNGAATWLSELVWRDFYHMILSQFPGCDAQPYFRVFNPESQSRRFDPEGKFIKSVLPELRDCSAKLIHAAPGVKGYPEPIVEHSIQRDKAIALFKKS